MVAVPSTTSVSTSVSVEALELVGSGAPPSDAVDESSLHAATARASATKMTTTRLGFDIAGTLGQRLRRWSVVVDNDEQAEPIDR